MRAPNGVHSLKESALARVGVVLKDPTWTHLHCVTCDRGWAAGRNPAGRRHRGFWVCPHFRCNADWQATDLRPRVAAWCAEVNSVA